MEPAETQIRFGILGCAQIAQKLSRAINLAPNAALYAVASRSPDKAKAFASANGFPTSAKVYGSYEALLDDPEVDAVYVPLPTSLHREWAVKAAGKKKHVLLEKPVALNAAELEEILEACESNGVQFMDATMWMHHPRTAVMKELLHDSERFGDVKAIHSTFTFAAGPDFLTNNIRVSPHLDALGALGDVGWYCIRAILWAASYHLPRTAVASRNHVLNDAGVILSCGASLYWPDGKVATFHCSFLASLTMDLTVLGTKSCLRVHDFVGPFDEEAASFHVMTQFAKPSQKSQLGKPLEERVACELPQEARMVGEFAYLVARIKESGCRPEKEWGVLSWKTQLVLDAVKASIDRGFEPVEIVIK